MPEIWTELVTQAKSGDHQALEKIAEHALRIGTRTAAGIVRQRQDVDDVAQEVALEILRNLHKLRDAEKFEIWAHRIAARRSIRTATSLRNRTAREFMDDSGPRLESQPAPGPSPSELAELGSAHAALRAAMGMLPPRQRAALVLRYVHDLPQEDIAKVLHCRRGTAGALVSRALAALRRNEMMDNRPQEETT